MGRLRVRSGPAAPSVESTSNNHRTGHTHRFPRVLTIRARDGERVAMRQYADTVQFSYVDTVVYALLGEHGRAWVMSSDRATSLHAVDPLTLADEVSWATLASRLPQLRDGI